MNKDLEYQLLDLAEKNRDHLSEDFFHSIDYIEASLCQNKWPIIKYHTGVSYPLSARILNAVLDEFGLLLCTEDEKYGKVREKGKLLSKVGVSAIASYLAGSLGIAIGVATGVVSFIALIVLKIGIGVFCRIYKQNNITE